MHRRSVNLIAALAILSAGSVISGRADAGGATSAPSKYSREAHTVAGSHVAAVRRGRHETLGITEFSSSSATNYPQPPKR
jgi:hypothetical protein